jgi:hypothetical protein
VTTVTYAKLFNLGNYENERIELEDQVGPDETNEAALERVRQWVEAQGVEARRRARRGEVLSGIEERISSAETRLRSVDRKHRDAVKKYGQLRDLLALHGVPIAELDTYWDLPTEQPQADDGQADDQADEEQFVSYDKVEEHQVDEGHP